MYLYYESKLLKDTIPSKVDFRLKNCKEKQTKLIKQMLGCFGEYKVTFI